MDDKARRLDLHKSHGLSKNNYHDYISDELRAIVDTQERDWIKFKYDLIQS
jgi:hypothetical protein